MDEWIRPRLDDLASDAPKGSEVPPTLKKRARIRMTMTVLTSLFVVASLGVVAVAGVRSLSGGPAYTGTGPSPSVEPREPDLHIPNRVTVTLTDAGCTLDWEGDPIDPRRVEFTAENDTDGWAVFDIGRLTGGHSLDELAAHVEGLGTGTVGMLPQDVIRYRPSYFQGSLDGTVIQPHGGGQGQSLLRVYGSPLKWSAPYGGQAPEGTYAVICYRGSASAGGLVPAGVAGPVEVGSKASVGGPRDGVDVGEIQLSEAGCAFTATLDGIVDARYIELHFDNDTDERVAFDIGTLADGHTFEELAAHVESLQRTGSSGHPTAMAPLYFERSDAALAWARIGGAAVGRAGPGLPTPLIFDRGWTGWWSGPSEEIGPISSETLG